jgi:hypothetical protein
MHKKLLLLTFVVIFIPLVTLFPRHIARADSYEVTNTDNSGPGSLRQAITDANNHPGADTITFAASTNGTPIVLVGPAGENVNASGDLDILDGGDLTIQGNGTSNTVIDGSGIDRVFHVCPGGGCTHTVTFSSLTIQNGTVSGGGGGIRNEAGTTIVDGSILLANIAINGGGISNFATLIIQNGSTIGGVGNANIALFGNGGGIYNYAGTTTVDGSTISANLTSKHGGGIWNQATLNIQNGSLIGETGAGNIASNDGGGIYNFEAGIVTVFNSTISANNATGNGGGIYNQSTLMVQNGSLIGGSGTSNSAALGGGIFNNSGTTTIDGSTISANTATDGAGIHNKATLTIQNGSTIGGSGAGNIAGNVGGGILNALSGTATVSGSTVSANSATIFGGGILNLNTLNIQDGSSIGVIGAGNTAADGGGIFNTTGTTTVTDSEVVSNTATTNGGGIFNQLGGEVILDSSTFSANRADDYGGGVYNLATLTVQNGSLFTANTAISYGGGAIYNDGTTTVENSSINDNLAKTWDAGGIYNDDNGVATVDGSTVNDNTADDYGGAIYNDGTLYVQNGSTINNNTSLNDNGGGIYNDGNGTATVDDSTVNDNTASDYGGGIYNERNATLIVQNGSTIGVAGAGNSARWGGGIYSENYAEVTIDSSIVNSNTATYGYGGGIYNDFTLAFLNSSIIAGNTAARPGGGIYNGGPMTVTNSFISDNQSDTDGGGIYNDGTLIVNGGSTIIDNKAANGGGIFNDRDTIVIGSRILNNRASNTGGGVYNDWDITGAISVTGSCIVGNSLMSFFNFRDAQQIATANWWGAATGPNTPGADTVLGNVDVSNHLTEPILGCAPDLQVGKSNDVGGIGYVGTPFHWTLSIANTGPVSGTFKAGDVILVDELPAGPTYGTPITGNFVDLTNSGNIDCSLAGDTLTCEVSGGDVTLKAVTGSFDVTISVTLSAEVTLVNPAGICQVDPDGVITEANETNNDCPANAVDVSIAATYLPLVLR